MKRPASIKIAGALLLVGSAAMLLLSLGRIAMVYKADPATAYWHPAHLRYLPWMVPDLALSAWMITTAVGLFHLRPWARVSLLTICVLAVNHFSRGLLNFLTVWNSGDSTSWVTACLRGGAISALGFIGVGSMGLAQFSNPRMSRLFFTSATRATASAGAPTGEPPTPELSESARPLSIFVIATWLLTVWTLALYSILFRLPKPFAFRSYPIPPSPWGPATDAYCVAVTLIAVAVGFGLLAMRPWARVGATALCIFTIACELVAGFRFGVLAQTAENVASWSGVWISNPSYWLRFVWSALPPAVALWLIIAPLRMSPEREQSAILPVQKSAAPKP